MSERALPHDLVLPADADRSLVLPRVCYWPRQTYGYSVGLDAIEVAAAAGLTLDAWQQACIQLGLGKTEAGAWAAFQVALIVARQNGKGSILEALELYWLFVSEERLIGHSAHEYKTAMEAFRRVLFLITNTDWMRKRVKKVINTNGEEGIELLTGQRLRFLARSKGAGRGFSFNKLVWDEGYALTEAQEEAQLPTLSAIPDAQLWITSSPPLDPTSGGALFRIKRKVDAGTAESTVMLDYGAAGSLDDLSAIALDDRETWKRTNPAFGIRISMAAIERERSSLSDSGFARERLGVWPPDLSAGFTVISADQWERLKDAYSGKEKWEEIPATMKYWPDPSLPAAAFVNAAKTPPTALTGKPALAVSVSPRSNGQVRASIGLAQTRADGKVHIELIKSGPGTAWVIPDLVTLRDRLDPCAVVIDPGSPAGSLVAEAEAAGLDVTPMSARDVAAAFGMIYDAANTATEQEPSVVHIGQPEVAAAVAGAGKRPVGDGHAWDRRNANTDITPIDSLTQALWGLRQAPAPAVLPWMEYA
jgi:hypothetical protein